MLTDPHGGGCCGITHLHSFLPNPDKDWLERDIQRAVDYVERDYTGDFEEGDFPGYYGKFGHLIEVALTDDQMMRWAPTLKELGFRLGPRWLNDNSGNYCNLLTWQSKKPSKPRPFTW